MADVTVDYEELDGSPVESQGPEGFSAQMRLLCAWAERHTLMRQILARPRTLYPHNPLTLALAKSASSQPHPGQMTPVSGRAAYEKAIVTVSFETPRGQDQQEEVGEDIISESLEPASEFLTLDHNLFRWGSGSGDRLEEKEAPGLLLVTCDYIVTTYGVPTVPPEVLSLIGHVNDAAVTANLLGVSFAAETLLYNPPTLTRVTRSEASGIVVGGWDVTTRFTYRPEGWNKFWRAKTQAWESLYVAGGAEYKNFQTGNFNAL